MSAALGPLAYGAAATTPDGLGACAGGSAGTARAVDAAVRGIIEVSYARAREILEAHDTHPLRLAEALIEHETLDREQIEEVLRSQAPCGQASPRTRNLPGSRAWWPHEKPAERTSLRSPGSRTKGWRRRVPSLTADPFVLGHNLCAEQ